MTPVNLLDTVIMKFPFSSRNDYIVLYHAGFGGEFITGLLSQNVPGANRLDITPAPTGANRWAIVCKVGYSDIYFSNGKDFKKRAVLRATAHNPRRYPVNRASSEPTM